MGNKRIEALIFAGLIGVFAVTNIGISEKYNIDGKTVGLIRYLGKQELSISKKDKTQIFGDSWKNGTLDYVRIEEDKRSRTYRIGELTEEQRLELQNQFDAYRAEIKIEKLRNKGFFEDFN
jgi:hypothetical protein